MSNTRSWSAIFAVFVLIGALVGPALPSRAEQPEVVTLCHVDGSGTFRALTTPKGGSSIAAHLGHGDGRPGDEVPGQPGMFFDADCSGLADADGDGVPDDQDVCPGGDDHADADGDGVPDACDVCAAGDDAADADGDGVPDACDVCAAGDDAADADGDGVPDACDVCAAGDDAADADGDGVPDACDVCAAGDDAADADGDGVPDACDVCPGEDDAVGCEPLGTGDVQVTLRWVGNDDLDLHVFEPSGEHIYFGNEVSSTNGQLDVDDVPQCDGSPTDTHVENVFWPIGDAPDGTYETYVDVFTTCDGVVDEWTLTIKVDGVVVQEHTSNVDMGTAAGPTVTPYSFDNPTPTP